MKGLTGLPKQSLDRFLNASLLLNPAVAGVSTLQGEYRRPLRASAVKPASALKGGEAPRSRRRLMRTLVAVQAAFCFLVLFVAGLFVATFDRLSNQPTGFSAERILILDTVAGRALPQAFWDQGIERLQALPGVERVALAGSPLLRGSGMSTLVSIDGARPTEPPACFLSVSPGWTDTMKILFVGGRDFRSGDAFPGAAIVNQAFAKQYFGGENPIGKTFEMAGSRVPTLIVGLVREARHRNMREPIPPVAYVPFRSLDARGALRPKDSGTFIVRTSGA